MAVDLIMPKLGLTMEEGTVVRWLVAEGDQVKKGQPVLEVETDKVVVEVEATASGVMGPLLVGEGETVPITTLLARIYAPREKVGEKVLAPRITSLARRMAEKEAFIEHCFSITMPLMARLNPMIIVEAVRAVGAEHCIMSTDLGQAHNPAPAEGMRMGIATMLRCGLTEKEIELMIKVNPAKLLGLD